jgi:DNA-binding transcriptional MerR regulator
MYLSVYMATWKHADVLKIFPDIKPRTLISWAEKGLITPEVLAKGSGTRREYTLNNLLEIGIIKELVSRNVPHPLISQIVFDFSTYKHISQNYDLAIIVAMISAKLPKKSSLRSYETPDIKIVMTEQITETIEEIYRANDAVTYVSMIFVFPIWKKITEMVQET